MNIHNGSPVSIERWGPTLFLVGGTLLLGHAAVQGIEAFTKLSPPPDVFATTGHFIALVGLFSLYPKLADRRPRLARVRGAVAVVSLVGWGILAGTRLLTVSGAVSWPTEALPAGLGLLVIGSTILTYTLFGLATIHIDTEAGSVGTLVLAPAVLLTALIVAVAVTGASALVGVIIGGGLAVALLTLGYRLQKWDRSTNYGASAGDPTAR